MQGQLERPVGALILLTLEIAEKDAQKEQKLDAFRLHSIVSLEGQGRGGWHVGKSAHGKSMTWEQGKCVQEVCHILDPRPSQGVDPKCHSKCDTSPKCTFMSSTFPIALTILKVSYRIECFTFALKYRLRKE